MRTGLNCKKLLFIGEEPFLYTRALVCKYRDRIPNLASAITSTELNTEPSEETRRRIEDLERIGVKILLGVDAKKLHKNPELANKRFNRIQWVCPHAGGPYIGPNNTEGKTSRTLADFFNSASHLQKPGDEVRVVLAQGTYPEWRQEKAYGLVKAAKLAKYALVEKRDFSSKRYPGYEHRQTGKSIPAEAAVKKSVEFIFKKRAKKSAIEKAIDLFGPIKHKDKYKRKYDAIEVKIINIIYSLLELSSSAPPFPNEFTTILLFARRNLAQLIIESRDLRGNPELEEDYKTIHSVVEKIRKLISTPSEIHPKKLGKLNYYPSPKGFYNRYPKADPSEPDKTFQSQQEYYESDSDSDLMRTESDIEMIPVENS